MTFIGVDIGGHHIAGAIVPNSIDRIDRESSLRVEIDRKGDAASLLDGWASCINRLIEQAGDDLGGIGVAIPGPFDYVRGIGRFAGNDKFETLNGVDVGKELQRRLSERVALRFINDATAFAVGCTRIAPTLADQRVIAITLGTGFGSAFLHNGFPQTEGDNAGVPLHGCLWHLPFATGPEETGIADDFVSSRWLLRQSAALDVAGPSDVAEMARHARTDEALCEIFERYGANLGQILAPWASAFNADAIVLGGNITRAFDLFSTSFEHHLAKVGPAPSIAIHQETENAAIIGAVATFDDALWSALSRSSPTL